ncbi:SRPBCC family protein [Allokutzneria sp. A3M-2-11 16]|uniref:SRPBCC family protein n=1 Tax=Allokutzneria sp. A3M-2-11 16 TaxID=2962043 RepID=UPI0020B90056|nr:SRPBCC family protein [Allokutzneria sp. A3M-2-11 16]MCP3800789.1 SRPBCC family protein [Allokutzneria sp. A3M-2-11 16]
MAADQVVSRSVVINAPPERVFEVLANPYEHANFDGSGSVRGQVHGPGRLALGTKFGMRMRVLLPYRIENEVVEFEPDRLIAWQHTGRHRWRYRLEPAEGGTLVTESFDWGTARSPKALELLGYPKRNAKSIEQTLARLKTLIEQRAG